MTALVENMWNYFAQIKYVTNYKSSMLVERVALP